MACAAIGPGSLFGLVTFSPIPVVKHIMIPADMDGHIPVDLEMAMPLCAFLAPGIDGVTMGGRGFSAAMDALIKYLGTEHGVMFAMGPPDYRTGQLDTQRYSEQYASKRIDADKALLPEQTPFYKDLAANTAQSGVCVDLFVITNEYADLALLKYLSIECGGCLLLYSNTNEATLPQDLYCMLSQPYAFGCGLLWPFLDPQYGNVQHIICCDQYATCAFDFGFSNSSGFTRNQDSPPVLQLAFQYSILIGVATNYAELYESAQPEVILTVLTHKVIQASLEDGVKEACALLHDWLVILTAQYNEYNKLAHPLLQSHEEGVHPDHCIYLQCLFSALEPFDLLQAMHPVLSSYATPDKQAYPQHSLSQAALITSGSPIFFLDAFTCLIVYYSPTVDPALPFPPPQNFSSVVSFSDQITHDVVKFMK
ncbi:hypothetical protein BDL97_12G067200 [Sphagnum fallax]|nr:hypothetical protein BDL97_12G067200 [Sphagnum fallax]